MDFLIILQTFFLSYGAFAIYGLAAAALCGWLLCKKAHIPPMKLLPFLVLGLVPLYLGAKGFGILSLCAYRVNIGRPLDWTVVENSGIVFYGGLLGFLLYARLSVPMYMKEQAPDSLGIAAVCIPLFHTFARVGCYFGHCCYGILSSASLWTGFYEGRVPVQLMEAGFNLLLFGLLLYLFMKKPAYRGRLPRLYLLLYACFRLGDECIRGDAIRGFIGPLSFSQWVSMGILLYLLLTALTSSRRQKNA